MKILLLGKGVSSNGVKQLLEGHSISFDILNTDEVKNYDYDLVVKSPGIKSTNEVVQKFKSKNINVISDVELVYNLLHPQIIGLSGSNGKTTTVNLIYQMIKESYRTCMCGNIGYSVAKALTENPYCNYYICELSSFMLEDVINFSPKISVLLNIRPCHLDMHDSYINYINAKKNITINQTESDYFIYNFDDTNCKAISKDTVARRISFSLHSTLSNCYIFSNCIYLDGKKVISLKNIKNKSEHFLYDVMASICVAKTLNISNRIIKKVLKNELIIEYRLNKLSEHVYNDAKSTNPYSTIEAIKTIDKPLVLICGGYDRKEYLDSLVPYLKNIKTVYLYGDTKDKFYEFFTNYKIPAFRYNTLEEVCLDVFKNHINEYILYSPMCASYDQYDSYVSRGKEFNKLFEEHYKGFIVKNKRKNKTSL